jgi:hypothetical protein
MTETNSLADALGLYQFRGGLSECHPEATDVEPRRALELSAVAGIALRVRIRRFQCRGRIIRVRLRQGMNAASGAQAHDRN